MNENVFVILGLDYHLPRIKKVIASIREHHQNVPDIAISNYGVLWPEVKPQHMNWHEQQKKIELGSVLRKFCQANGLHYYQPSPETFNFAPKICPNDEALSMIHISHHFYELGYSYVYLLHNDIHFRGDSIIVFKEFMKGKWSFIAPLHHQQHRHIDCKQVATIGSRAAYSWCRAGIDFFLYNKEFIFDMYRVYETEKRMWDEVFSKYYSACGDLALLDIAKDKLLNYEGILIPEKIEIAHGCAWVDELGFE